MTATALALIDRELERLKHRKTVPATDVVDMLLDLRNHH